VNGDPRRLARALGHEFERRELLEQALTHRSAGPGNNERLEFLGDALLGFVIAQALWERFPDADEGRLSRLRASLVNKESLAQLARGLDLGSYLRLGAGELRTGGHTRDSILADAVEAVFAAVYLDRGFPAAKRVILDLYLERLERVVAEGAIKDPKTRLQERLQASKRPLPIYDVLDVIGSQHDQTFFVICSLSDSEQSTKGRGTSRRRAEQHAAEQMLELIEHGA
jgi:ribonuclease-3